MPVRDLLSAASTQGASPADPYFYDVSLLLNGDGTNGSQNNTFLDSSTNNFTITRNGNTTQGSFSPYGNLWSNYFGGVGYFKNTTTLIAQTQSTFSIECSVNLASYTLGSRGNIIGLDSATAGDYFNFGVNGSGNVLLWWYDGAIKTATSTGTVPLNTWTQIAITVNSNAITFYINGVASGTGTLTNRAATQGGFVIGAEYNGNNILNGYLSNLRVTNTAITPTLATAPLTVISGTQLLTCQSNRFIDNSSNAFAITINGTPSVQRFSPFNPTAPYDTSVIGGSGYFDGSSSYLTSPSNSAYTLGATGDFTVECWAYLNGTQGTSAPILLTNYVDWNTGYLTYWILQIRNGNQLNWLDSAGNNAITASSTTAIAPNTWNHIAVVRSGTTITMYINGVSVGTYTGANQVYTGTNALSMGYVSGANYINGYISNARIVKGTAVYTSTFTPPTAPLSAITNTSFLTNMVNAGIPDLAMQNDLETVGNAQVSTSVKKYGTGSLSFNGTSDYLTGQLNTVNNFGSGNFTVEGWIYPNSVSTNQWIYTTENNASYSFAVYISSSGKLSTRLSSTGSSITTTINGTTTLATGTWYYAAIVRNGTTVTIYLNGTSDGSGTFSGAVYPTGNNFGIGAAVQYPSATVLFYNGYIDDLRITNGLARYTTTFTPPTAALPTY